ncbi:PIN domain-containing protein [Phaeodactylibacter sp.]|jgi:predicted nucleic acid-binding protein|uniref:type II toxin-antitoxin system VapC family toxin n=1 Tax=Phaeodactylibacter sp. TaxID=1940289 RepID=UPI0025CC4A7D|nr:PIN domain-containing protein [Phaeodactylibacter sp.]MCI4651184.1 PIN domain-containing protein [Phaeodactylibacter sp.]MCI5094582.1 PIN domain-containing protein [Phaeodactylibacter sp.]
MNSYFDTSVLFPAMVEAHPLHKVSKAAFRDAVQQGKVVCLSTHLYAELYANLTRFPRGNKISPVAAARLITSLRKTVATIELGAPDYEAALHRCAQKGLVSGVIYDALHLQAALKAEVSVLYSNNFSDFERLLDPADKIELKAVP